MGKSGDRQKAEALAEYAINHLYPGGVPAQPLLNIGGADVGARSNRSRDVDQIAERLFKKSRRAIGLKFYRVANGQLQPTYQESVFQDFLFAARYQSRAMIELWGMKVRFEALPHPDMNQAIVERFTSTVELIEKEIMGIKDPRTRAGIYVSLAILHVQAVQAAMRSAATPGH